MISYEEIKLELLILLSEFGVRPGVPNESIRFFKNIVEGFEGTKEELFAYIRRNMNIQKWFKSIGAPPEWIQEPEWPFNEGQPMIFVGQIGIPQSAGYYRQDTNFYVFWDPNTGDKTVIDQSY